MELEGKVAIVTGGGQGIGRAISLLLAREGASVTIADINSESASNIAHEIDESGGSSLATRTDVSNAEDVGSMVTRTIERFGTLDILINNAGIVIRTPLPDIEESDWQQVIDVNLKGTFLCTRAAIRQMIPRNSGRIVNMASGQWFRPIPSVSSYAASKGGIVSFTKAAALEMAPYGISVNALAPGFTDTPITRSAYPSEEAWNEVIENSPLKPPLGNINQPEDIAQAALFLVRPASRHITGQTLHVNGGSFMW